MADESALIAAADDTTFDETVLRAPAPVLVVFGASWCAQCKALHPVIAGIAADYQGRLKVVQIDVDQSPNLADQFDITNLPTLLFFKNGENCGDIRGMLPKSKILEVIEDFLAV